MEREGPVLERLVERDVVLGRGVGALGEVPRLRAGADHVDGAAAKVAAESEDVARGAADDEGAEVRVAKDLVEGEAGEVWGGVGVGEDGCQGGGDGEGGGVEEGVGVCTEVGRGADKGGPGEGEAAAGEVGLAGVGKETEALRRERGGRAEPRGDGGVGAEAAGMLLGLSGLGFGRAVGMWLAYTWFSRPASCLTPTRLVWASVW